MAPSMLLRRARRLFPFIKRIFADGGYAGEKMALVVWRTGAWKLEIVKRADVSWLRGLAQKMDCRKDVRLDQSQSPPGSRLRALRHNRRRLRPPRRNARIVGNGFRECLPVLTHLAAPVVFDDQKRRLPRGIRKCRSKRADGGNRVLS